MRQLREGLEELCAELDRNGKPRHMVSVKEIRALLLSILRGVSADHPTQNLRERIEDLRCGHASVEDVHTALLILEYRLDLPLTKPEDTV